MGLSIGRRDLVLHGDERGSLVALEVGVDVPFTPVRVYYIFGSGPDVRRGSHAHHECRQLAVCVSGSCCFHFDDGVCTTEVSLSADRPEGVLIEPMVWHEMYDFSADCVLVVLASHSYDEADYIRAYHSFQEILGRRTERSDEGRS